jgi:hypothetical protein
VALDRRRLHPDCRSCSGLCCVAPAFEPSADFPFAKPPGQPCLHLTETNSCAVHDRLAAEGFAGCVAFDCFGAGQTVTEAFAPATWRSAPEIAEEVFSAFTTTMAWHEMLWYLAEAADRLPAGPLRAEAAEARERVALVAASIRQPIPVDVGEEQRRVGDLLDRASSLLRSRPAPGPAFRTADLAGHLLAGADLSRADLRGACLIRADLRGADLRISDLLGADLRSADIRGADLSGALFVTQAQLQSAVGDRSTRLPAGLERPPTW